MQLFKQVRLRLVLRAFQLLELLGPGQRRIELGGQAFAFEPVAIAGLLGGYFVAACGVEEVAGSFFVAGSEEAGFCWPEAWSFRSSGITIWFANHSARRFSSSVSGRGSGVMWRMPLPYIILDLPCLFAMLGDQDVNKVAPRRFGLRGTQSEPSPIAGRKGSGELFGEYRFGRGT